MQVTKLKTYVFPAQGENPAKEFGLYLVTFEKPKVKALVLHRDDVYDFRVDEDDPYQYKDGYSASGTKELVEIGLVRSDGFAEIYQYMVDAGAIPRIRSVRDAMKMVRMIEEIHKANRWVHSRKPLSEIQTVFTQGKS